jgi:hypothetical protein
MIENILLKLLFLPKPKSLKIWKIMINIWNVLSLIHINFHSYCLSFQLNFLIKKLTFNEKKENVYDVAVAL